MNYEKLYIKIINRFKNEQIDKDYEIHHIIPKCLGGIDEKSNLVKLPYRYHLFAHLLLCKIFPAELGILTAAYLMSGNLKYQSSRNYERLKREYILSMSGCNNKWYGTNPWHTPNTINKSHIITTYYYADEIYNLWISKAKLNASKLKYYLPHENKSAIITLVKLFKNDWVPQLNSEWKSLRKNFTPIRKLEIVMADKAVTRKDWASDNVKNNTEKINIWANADVLYDYQKSNNVGYRSIAKAFNVNCGLIQSVIIKIQSGWNPTLDPEWQFFRQSVDVYPLK